MYDDILVPTDGSEAAQRAVEHALNLATQYDARLHALYVVDANAYSTLEAGTDVVLTALEQEGEESVKEVADLGADAGLEVVTEVVTGGIYRSIIDYAEDNSVDLIVMGTHGRSGIDRYLLGSVTEKVVRSSPVPVLTIRAPDEE